MTATLSPEVREATNLNHPELIIEYGFNESTQEFFYNKKGVHTPCSSQDLLQATEGYQIPEEDRGALLLGIPF